MVGIFSKLKDSAEARRLVAAEESLEPLQPVTFELVGLLKSWVPEDFSCDINNVRSEAQDIRDNVELLVLVAVERNDQQLYSFVAATCESFRPEFQFITIDGLARHLTEGTESSMQLRKKYKSVGVVLEALTILGLAALFNLEQHPKYQDSLEYISNNS